MSDFVNPPGYKDEEKPTTWNFLKAGSDIAGAMLRDEVKKTGGNVAAFTAGIGGDYQDWRRQGGAQNALRPRSLPTSDELVDRWGDREHWSYWPAMFASPMPNEVVALGKAAPAIVGAGALTKYMDMASEGARGNALLARLFPKETGGPAYHGGPHKFDVPSNEYMGTGEGAQAYGWGHYVAESEGVGGNYRDALSSGNRLVYTGFDEIPPEVQKVFDEPLPGTWTESDLLNSVADSDNQKAAKWLDEHFNDLSTEPINGHLYEYDIPPEDIAKMLDWDAPLSEQPKLREVFDEFGLEAFVADDDPTGGVTVRALEDFFKQSAPGSGFEDMLPDSVLKNMDAGMRPDQAASLYLNERGIPGIKYLDGSSRRAGEGTRNMVLFDPENTVRSVKRDGEEVYNAMAKPTTGGVDNAMVESTGFTSRFRTVKEFNEWKKATPDSDPDKRRIMYEVLDEERVKVDSGALERDGRPYGSPKGMTPEKRDGLVQEYAARIERGIDAFPPGYFYEEGRQTIRGLTPDPYDQRIVSHTIDETSSQVGPAENVNYTVRARNQRAAGTEVNTTIYPNKARPRVNAIAEGQDIWTGYKRDRYGNLLTPEEVRAGGPAHSSMPPNDRWEFFAGGWPQGSVPSDPKNVAYMDRFRQDAVDIVNARRAEKGLEPITLENGQEIQWAVIRAETEGRPLRINPGNDQIGGAFNRLRYSHTYEATPGQTTGQTLTPEGENVLLGEFNQGGRDPLVASMGGDLQQPVQNHMGYYDGQYNRGQTSFSYVDRTDSYGLGPASEARVTATEGIRNLALAQDAGAGNVFTPLSKPDNPFNGVSIAMGDYSQADLRAAVELGKKIDPNMVVVDSTEGIRAWIPGDNSKAAQRKIEDFSNRMDRLVGRSGKKGEMTYGSVESQYLPLDWEGGNATQDVLDMIDNIAAEESGYATNWAMDSRQSINTPGIYARANSPETRRVLGSIAKRYDELKAAGLGVPNEKLVAVLKTWAKDGLPGVREMVRKGLAPAAVLGVFGASQQNALMEGA